MEARHAAMLAESPVRAAVLPEGAEPPDGALDAWVEVEAPRYALAGLVALFEPGPHAPPGVHPTADVAGDAVLGPGVSLGPFVSDRAGSGDRRGRAHPVTRLDRGGRTHRASTA